MTKAFKRRRVYGFCVVLLGCLFFAVRGYHDETLAVQSRDFKTVYAGARCLIDGCDPYNPVQVESAFLLHGGNLSDSVPFAPFYAGYPPSALFLLTPLALLPFGPAHLVWLGIGILLFSAAALCMADLCVGQCALIVDGVLAAFVATSTLLIMLGQPAMLSISLLVVAVWCFLRQRFMLLGIVAFAISLTLKPQVGALVWLFFLLAARSDTVRDTATHETPIKPAWTFRRLALYTLLATLMLMTPGILLAFHHPASADWPQELHANLVGIAAHGNFSDPGPGNPEAPSIASLQTLFSLIRDTPRFYNRVAIAVFAPLLLAWLYLVMRPVRNPDRRLFGEAGPTATAARDLLALATAAALNFLPIYHRQYDTRLLLLMFPAVALLTSTKHWRGKMALALSAVATVTMSHQFAHLGPWLGDRMASLPPIAWVIFYRPLPLTLLLLTCFFLYCMFLLAFEKRRA